MKKFVGLIFLVVLALSLSAIVFADNPNQEREEVDWDAILARRWDDVDLTGEFATFKELLDENGNAPPPIELTWEPMCTQYAFEMIASYEARGSALTSCDMILLQRMQDTLANGYNIYTTSTRGCIEVYETIADFESSVGSLINTIEPLGSKWVSVLGLRFINGVTWVITNVAPNGGTFIQYIAVLNDTAGFRLDTENDNGWLGARGNPDDFRRVHLFGMPWGVSTLDIHSINGGQISSGSYVVWS